MKKLSIAEIQELLKDKTNKEGGEILSTDKSGNWCGIWYDWFCSDCALKTRASKFVPYIKLLKGEWTKTHTIWLKNNCPAVGSLYDDIRISPLDKNIASYNIGFSWGNKTTREREIFDTRGDVAISDTLVKSCKEASKLVNEIMKGNK